MSQTSRRPEVDWNEIQTAVRVKAWRGYKAGVYPRQDLRDVEQSLSVYVLERLDRFDPERGSLATFLKHALKGGIADISRRSNAACRSLPGGADMEPFDSMVDTSDGPPAPLCQTLTQEDVERRNGCDSRSPIEQFEFAHDVDCIIALMTKRQQRICRNLMVHGAIRTQKRSGLTRLSFDHAVSDIATIFAANDYDLRDVVATNKPPSMRSAITCAIATTIPSRCCRRVPARVSCWRKSHRMPFSNGTVAC